MAKKSFLVKTVLMSMLTAVTFSFTSCQDDILDPDMAPQTEKAMTRVVYDSNYNLNDHAVKIDGTPCEAFNRQDWRGEGAVFIFTGNQEAKTFEVTDESGNPSKQGYQLVNMPWTNNSCTSYIPQSVIDDLQGDPEWKLVMMQCGNEGTRNGNYLGFYHKYRGILRIMTYLKPGKINKTNYLWGYSLGDKLAAHSVFGYALPKDKVGMVENSKRVLNMSDRLSKTVTPMMNKTAWSNPNGSIQPNEGWWSFDIDLSVYNPGADATKTAASDVMMSLNPLGYSVSDYEFSSALKAVAGGNIKMEQYQSSSDGEVAGAILKGLDVIGKAADFVGKCAEGKVAEAISSGVDLAKTGCEIAGLGSEQKGYEGDIHLDMSGKITTSGQSSTGAIFDEMPAASLKIGCFDFKDNTFGQGVWNLETAPVVYCTDAETNWRSQWVEKCEEKDVYNQEIERSHTQIFGPVESPFGGLYDANAGSAGGKKSEKPWHGLVCFFDPSSVKVSLNPQVFKDSEIRTAQVTAVCGVRKGTSFSRYDQYRTAQKLKSAKHRINTNTYQFTNRPTSDAPFNAYGRGVHQFSADPVDGWEVGCIGGGDDDYLIEPVGLRAQSNDYWNDYYLPTYEVTVSVKIKLDNGKTIVLSRAYLPEIKDMGAMQVENYYNQLKDRKIGMPGHYVENLYNEQVARIGQLNHWIRTTLIATGGTARYTSSLYEDNEWYRETNLDHPLCSFSRLIDGDKESKWASHKSNRYILGVFGDHTKTVEKNCDHHCWFAEFKTYGKMKAKSFTLTSSNTGDNKKPRSVRFFARNDNQGEWVQLYYQNNIQMPSGQNTEMTFVIPSPGYYNTYRFEVVDNWGGDWLDLNELTLNWAE
jgi:hypothetical protein